MDCEPRWFIYNVPQNQKIVKLCGCKQLVPKSPHFTLTYFFPVLICKHRKGAIVLGTYDDLCPI